MLQYAAGDAHLVEADRLLQRPARRLDDAAFDLVADTIWINDLTAVVGGNEPHGSHVTGLVLQLDLDRHRENTFM